MSFEPVKKCFTATGGAWLEDEGREFAGGRINLIGLTCLHGGEKPLPLKPHRPGTFCSCTFPASKKLDQKFDLMLAGHSPRTVRFPFRAAHPSVFSGQVDLGLFQTESGPLYVNPGIGYLHHYNLRFNYRPEITVLEVLKRF